MYFALITLKYAEEDVFICFQSLTEVAAELKYTDLKCLMSCHICYLLSQWLDNDYVMADFPHRLMGYDKQVDFLRFVVVRHHGIHNINHVTHMNYVEYVN